MAERKLVAEDVVRIREIAARRGQTVREIANWYGVGVETVRRIIRRDTWTHLGEQDTRAADAVREEGRRSAERMAGMLAAGKGREEQAREVVRELERAPGVAERLKAFGLLEEVCDGDA